jgi:uncharacterized CHY-type Zn-finger protein
LRLFFAGKRGNKKKKVYYCVNCNKQLLKHKYKPAQGWNISSDGFLCSDCHIEKTREFMLKREDEKRKVEEQQEERQQQQKEEQEKKEEEESSIQYCSLCNKEIILYTDKNKPNWKWNMESGTILCQDCYQKKQTDFDRKLNYCAICAKKMGFIRYNPKPQWNINGQLCRQCWDRQNQKRHIHNDKD